MTKQKDVGSAAATPVANTPHVRTAVSNIIARMASAGIAKDRKNNQSGGGYNFRGIDDALNALAPIYVEEKVLVTPAYANRVATEFVSKGGGRMVNVTVEGTFKIVSLVDGSEIVSGPFIGEAMDSGDKATNKAMSVAYKNFAFQTYCIPIVGTDDPDYESPQVEPKGRPAAAKPQAQALPASKPAVVKGAAAQQQTVAAPADETVQGAINRLASSKEARKKLASVICGAYGVVVVDQLPEDKTAEAIGRLETYVQKQAQKRAA